MLLMLLATFQAAALPLLARAEYRGEWQRFACVESERLDVTLLVRRSVTPADPLFLGWEFNNKTNQPLAVNTGGYRLDPMWVEPLGGGPRLEGQNFIQGNDYDLFWREGPRPPEVGPRETLVPPGVTRRLAYASGYGHYRLADLNLIGLRIGGRAHLNLTLADGSQLTTPPEGVGFAFDYLPPDAAGTAAMRDQLAAMLKEAPAGVDDVVDAHHLRRLLGRPAVAEVAAVPALLGALEPEQAKYAARSVIVAYLAEHHADDPAVIGRYARGLADRGTSDWLRDLNDEAKAVTDKRLIDPLVARAADPLYWSDVGLALAALVRHRPLADDPAALSRRLGKIAAADAPEFFRDGTRWHEQAANNLVDAGDPATARPLAPFLDDPTRLYSSRDISHHLGPTNHLPIRVKDKAANAALQLLGENDVPRASIYAAVADEAAESARRDAVAARLRVQLTAADK